MPGPSTQNPDSGSRNIKLNTTALLEELHKIPEPDTFSLDFIWEEKWVKIYPADELIYDFKPSGILKIQQPDAQKTTTESQWKVSSKSKELTIETILEDSAFEIDFEVFNIVYITSDWMILESHSEDNKDNFHIFSIHKSNETHQKSLKDLHRELQESQISEKPNTFLLLMIFAIFVVILILMMSL